MKRDNSSLIDEELSMRDQFHIAIAKGDKELAKFIAERGGLEPPKSRNHNYYEEIFKHNRNQYRYSKHFNREVYIDFPRKKKDSPVEEIKLRRNGKETIVTITKTKEDLFKEDEIVDIYMYEESIKLKEGKAVLEQYNTRSRDEILKIRKKLKELNYDVTGHNIIREVIYNRREHSLSVATKAFIEILNRTMDRDKFGTEKMFCSHLNLEDVLERMYEDVYRVETLWWKERKYKRNKLRIKQSNGKYENVIENNAKEWFNNTSIISHTDSIDKSSNDVDKAIKVLQKLGLVKVWKQELVKDSYAKIWTGVDKRGWDLVVKVLNRVPNGHITRLEDIEAINRRLKEIGLKDMMLKCMDEEDKEFSKNIKTGHSFML